MNKVKYFEAYTWIDLEKLVNNFIKDKDVTNVSLSVDEGCYNSYHALVLYKEADKVGKD